MSTAFLWGGIGVLMLFVLIGFLAGLIRGLKRSALHIIFFVVSFVIAFFITKPITSAILGISITIDGTPTTLNNIVFSMLNKQFDLTSYTAVGDFAKTLPLSVASPIMFILIALITYFLFDIIYLIVARVAFGKKKKDFQEKKPLRWYGSAVGAVEGFLFMFLLFAPLTSLTQTYQQLATYDADQASATTIVLSNEEAENTSTIPTLPQLLEENVPSVVDEIIKGINGTVVGKISGAGGLNHAMFDFLSSSKVNGEKIHLRKDLLAVADTYNEFAVAYNTFMENDYENLDLTALKENLGKFLDEGIFKGVIAPTVQEIVVNFDVANPPEFLKGNELLSDLVTELKTEFSKPDFVAKTYLKEDLLKLVDIADELAGSGLIEEFKDISGKDSIEILKSISSKNTELKKIVDSAFELHILNDGFHALGEFASQKLAEFVDNESVKLNLSAENKSELISSTLDALDDVLALNDKLPFSTLLGDDLLGELSNIKDLDQVLVEAGETFDKIRELEILVQPAEEPNGEKTYVFDEILKGLKISLLGDTIHVTEETQNGAQETKTIEIKTYTDFFKVLAKPVKIAEKLDLLKLGQEGSNFQGILDKLLDEMNGLNDTESNVAKANAEPKTNPNLLSEVLLPFYELHQATFNTEDPDASIRAMIFDFIINQIDSNVEQISFEEVKAQDNYSNWETELNKMGETLLKLDNQLHKIESTNYTYIRYLLAEDVEDTNKMKTVLDQIVKDKTLEDILKAVFRSSVFDPLVDDIFDQLDSAIEDLTKVTKGKVTTSLTKLEGKEDEVAEILQKLMEFANDENNKNLNNVDLTKIGELLDMLKANALNGGTKDGVFSAVFENLIWYLTGDDISKGQIYQQEENGFSDHAAVKEYLNTNDYYSETLIYKNIFTEINEVEDFVQALKDNDIRKLTIHIESYQQDITNFLDTFQTVLSGLGDDTQQAKVLKNTKRILNLVDEQGNILPNEAQQDPIKSELASQINSKYSKDVAEGLLILLGLSEE